ncbi:MAG TPA: hypothetical protein VIH55_04460 [Acidimicrobiia bacterium]
MRRVTLTAGDWSADAYLAIGFADRLFGNRRTPPGSAVVLRTSSVHTFGQQRPIEIISLDAGMRVISTTTLPPRRVTVSPGARMIVELPDGSRVPRVDDRIEMTDV